MKLNDTINHRSALIVAFLILIVQLPTFAQELKISGRVLNATDSAVVDNAIVRLLGADDAVLNAAMSDSVGAFSALTNKAGELSKIEISFIGFSPIKIKTEGMINTGSIELGDLYMMEDSKVLEEVSVTGSLRDVNRQLIFPSKLQLQAGQDLATLLKNMSLDGLSVDLVSKNVTIYGKSVQWRVNGVPRAYTEVRNIRPSSILRIEYANSPSMRDLDRDHGGSINVVLKEREDGGSARVHLQSALWTGYVNGDAGASYHKGTQDLSVDYSLSYRNYKHWTKSVSEQFIGGGRTIDRVSTGEDSPFHSPIHNINLTYLYQPNDKAQFVATWRNELMYLYNDVLSYVTETDKQAYHRSSESKSRTYMPALDLFYQQTFKDGGKIEANAVATISTGKEDRNLEDKIGETLVAAYSNPVKTRYYSIIGEAAYSKLLHPKIYLNAGVQHKYAHTSNRYWEPTLNVDKMNQNNTYLYAQLSGRISGKLQYSVGSGAKLFYVEDLQSHRRYAKNQSMLSLYYTPNEAISFSLNSNLTPRLPLLNQLSNVVQRYDNLTVYVGNDALKSSYAMSNRINMSYRRGMTESDITLTYNRTTNPIFVKASYRPAEADFMLQTDNGKYLQHFGAEYKLSLNGLWHFMSLYGTAGYNFFGSKVADRRHYLNDFYWDISAQIVYKDWVLAGYYTHTSKSLDAETIYEKSNKASVTLMWNKGKWVLYAQMLYIGLNDGDSHRSINMSDVNPAETYICMSDNANMLTLGVVWNMDFGKRMRKLRRSIKNKDTNQSVVKVQ